MLDAYYRSIGSSTSREQLLSNQTNPWDIFNQNFLHRQQDFEGFWLYLLKGALDKQTRDALGLSSAAYIAREVGGRLFGKGPMPLDERDRPAVKALQKLGYAPVANVFSDAEIEEIHQYFSGVPGAISGGGAEGHVLLKDVPPNAGFIHFHAAAACACPPIYRLLHDERLITLASAYLGAPATIGLCTAWWSYPAPGGAEGMQMFHHDRGDFRSCNLFVYLTDVNAGSGPHAFVERTHEMQILLPLISERFGAQPEVFRNFWQWMEQHRKTDEEVLRFFPQDEVKFFTGPKGTSFFEDTRGLHKGTRPATGPRFAFEIFYSVLPKFNEEVAPRRRSELKLPAGMETDTAKLSPLVRYATRQILA